MLSTQYRLRLEAICERIATGESVELSEMIKEVEDNPL